MWKRVSYISSPESITGSDVKNMRRTPPNWATKELVLFVLLMEQTNSMELAHRLELLFIRWRPVLALSQLLISSPVLKNTFIDR